jgi:hypothetical protein
VKEKVTKESPFSCNHVDLIFFFSELADEK